MDITERDEKLESAMNHLREILNNKDTIQSEPLTIILRATFDMIYEVKQCYKGFELDAMKMLIHIGQIGNQTTRSPQFWRIAK